MHIKPDLSSRWHNIKLHQPMYQ